MQEYLWDQQLEAMNLVQQKKDYDKQQKDAKKKQLLQTIMGTVLSVGLAYGTGKLKSFMDSVRLEKAVQSNPFGGASAYDPTRIASTGKYFSSGGNALLMGGEFVANRRAVTRYGRNFFDSINSMSAPAPRFAMGGMSGMPSQSQSNVSTSGDTNISISINSDGSSSTKQSGAGEGDMRIADKIRKEVVRVIEEEKRVSGALSTRRRSV